MSLKPCQELESFALQIAQQLCNAACSFRISGRGQIAWIWDGLPPPTFSAESSGVRLLPVMLSTPVVRAGAHLKLSKADGPAILQDI